MAKVDRNDPKRADSSESRMSLMEFMREFPDDAACLEFLWRTRYSPDGTHAHCPKCDRERVFRKYAMSNRRTSWTCTGCGQHVHPTAGTIFHKSPTSLHLWFYAMYLMSSTRCGLSAKQLERELGVTYKTAWRMANLIRNKLMAQDGDQLAGHVEADETYVGGKPRAWPKMDKRQHRDRKTMVFGAVERGGKVRAVVVPDSRLQDVPARVKEFVLPASTLYTDEAPIYLRPGYGYRHRRIYHQARVYVSGDVHTQTIEGFFGLVKNGLRGTYHAVSRKWLPGYLNEFVFRYNTRLDPTDPFWTLLGRATPTA